MNIKPWQESHKDSSFPNEDYQIWSANFDSENSSEYFHLLSNDEKNRAARLINRKTAHQQIMSRGILRLLLGNYTGINPKEIVICNNPYGKPSLPNPEVASISFSLAHSGNLLLIAIGLGKKIGIDVEKIEEGIDFKGISALVFSPAEQFSLNCSKNPTRDFFTLWTAKEAILKALGLGFTYPSNQFSVLISKGSAAPSMIPTELAGGCRFSLKSFSPIPGYSAAFVEMIGF